MLRDFVAMALEPLADMAEPVFASTLREAHEALDAAPAALVLTDLSLGAESGLALVDRLLPEGGPPRAPVIVLSGDVPAGLESQLLSRGVSAVLRKPVPVAALLARVRQALPLDEGALVATPATVTAAGAGAVETYFSGDAALHANFRDACRGRFADAVAVGDAAAGRDDAPALAALCHTLKTLLLMLDAGPDVALTRAVEAAARTDPPAGWVLWRALRARLAARAAAGD